MAAMVSDNDPGWTVDHLIGRSRERQLIDSMVASLAEGTGGVVLLTGEPGIGTSTLARYATARAGVAGLQTAVGAGLPLTIGRPLQPILDVLESQFGWDEAATRTVLESTFGDPITLLLQRAISQLDRTCREHPTLLVLEDLQWVDETTLTLLHHHLTRADRRPLAILGTCRTPTPGSAVHQLLVAAGTATVQLDGLSDADVARLVQQRFGVAIDSADAAVLAAAGNPLLIEAIVSRALADGSSSMPMAPEPTLGGGPVRAAIDALAPPVSALVQVAAVMGHKLRVDALAALTGSSTSLVLERLAAARSAGVIQQIDGQLVFRHELYRTAVLDGLPASARQSLHIEIARELERIGASRLEVVEHVVQGAQPGNQEAIATLIGAADELLERDPSTALRITDRALDLLAAADAPEMLSVVRVRALAACGRSAEAEVLGRSLLATGLAGELEGRLRRDLALAAFVGGRPDEAEAHMTKVVALADHPERAARASVELGWSQMLALDLEGARVGADRGAEHGDLICRIAAESLRAWLGLWTLDLDLARRAADYIESAAALRPNGDWHLFQPLLAAAAVRLECEDLDAAERDAMAGRGHAIATGAVWAVAAHDALRATVAFRRGDLDRAASLASEALHATAILDSFGVEIWSRALLARIHLIRGDDELARVHVEAARVAMEDGRVQFGTDQLALAEAELQLHDGNPEAALGALAGGWEYLTAVGALYIRASVGVAYVRHLVAAERLESAHAISTLIGSDAEQAPLPHIVAAATLARAWVARDETSVGAAVQTAMDLHDVPRRWQTLHDAATILPASSEAPRWRSAAEELWRDLGGRNVASSGRRLSSPRRNSRAASGIGALTESEHRVALLVTQGLTNAKIAAHLAVSRRTVDTQVLAAYRKLGVSSRVGLTRALLDQ